MNIFVTGTDTGVGKTVIVAGLAAVLQSLGYKVGVFKPVQTGAVYHPDDYWYSPDLEFVNAVDENIMTKCTYLLRAPAAPVVSAPLDNETIDINNIIKDYNTLSEQCDFVIVEGIGGISVPVTPSLTVKDIIKILDLPIIIATSPKLGTINHTILTVEYANKYNIDVIGIIMSGYSETSEDVAEKSAPQVMINFVQSELLGIIPKIQGLSEIDPHAETIIELTLQNLNLEKIFKIKLPKLL